MSIDRRLFLAGAAASALPLRPVSAAAAPAVDSAILDFARVHDLSGSVSLGRAGRVVHQRVFGFADREARLPVGPDTRFRTGSVGKWFTALAVLRLAGRGRMRLDAPLRTYLPELTGPTGGVPLHHLLANDSGIPDRVTMAIKDEPALRASTAGSAAMVARFGEGPLAFAPGTRFDYSFFNWMLLHAAIERVTGQPFEAVLAREVFRPLGLRHTGFVDTRDGVIPGLAAAYGADGRRKEARVPPFGSASGNVQSTAADLLRAAYLAHRTGRLLSPALRAELVRVRVPAEDYALGGRVRTVAGRRFAWETGKVAAYRTHLAQDLGSDRGLVILSNNDLEQRDIAALAERLIALPTA